MVLTRLRLSGTWSMQNPHCSRCISGTQKHGYYVGSRYFLSASLLPLSVTQLFASHKGLFLQRDFLHLSVKRPPRPCAREVSFGMNRHTRRNSGTRKGPENESHSGFGPQL